MTLPSLPSSGQNVKKARESVPFFLLTVLFRGGSLEVYESIVQPGPTVFRIDT